MTGTPDIIAAFEGVSKVYDTGVLAITDCSLQVRRHEFVSLIGPSGCGKTTLLKLLAGIESATRGRVLYKGQPVSGVNTEVGFVPQDSSLFPWLTLQENVEYALRMRQVPKRERAEQAAKWIKIARLTGFEQSYPYQLSGGMQKRGSIIRTLIYNPEVLLMDEPFGPLDAQTRMFLQQELLEMWSAEKSTVLFVTHDLQEAVALSDRVVLFSHSPGTTMRVFDIPLSRPRDVFEIHGQEGFKQIYHEIWHDLREQVAGVV
ncbi:MAG TPA: ABC transporter ATP-binding protein [Burkholderiales bacterium]